MSLIDRLKEDSASDEYQSEKKNPSRTVQEALSDVGNFQTLLLGQT